MALSLLLISCGSQSLSDFREEGEALSQQLLSELRHIRTRDDLMERAPQLRDLFNQLAETMIRAQEYKKAHPEALLEERVHENHSLSDQLRIELNRVLNMEGGREVIENNQEEALNILKHIQRLGV